MIVRAITEDADRLEAFLRSRAATSMFLRGNLAAHGVEDTEHPHGTTYWLEERAGEMIAVAGLTNGGNLMCQAPDQTGAFWREMTARLKGRSVAGITGVPEQTAAWIAALGFSPEEFAINDVIPLFQLDLKDLKEVREGLTLRAPTEADMPMLVEWFDGFHRDTGLVLPQGETLEQIAQGFLTGQNKRILLAEGAPVAMTAINTQAVNTVQVGGVYVPPAHRGKGYGGAVVALHLAELARDGLQLAILFAANAIAARAYQSIGFQRVGSYRVAMLNKPLTVAPTVQAAMSLRER